MSIFKKILKFFLSLRTAIWLILALLFLLLYGSFIMPVRPEFRALHEIPLFQWMVEHPSPATWWLWGSICVLSILTTNTLICSIESVVRRREARQWLLIISPQIIHIGFLFILLAHLLSSYGGIKGMAFAYKDSMFQLPNGLEVIFDEVNAEVSASGYIHDWSSNIRYFENGNFIASDTIRPNVPSFRKGIGIYIKEVRIAPFPVALIEVSREPGAIWALIGGVLFLAGMIMLLALRIRREETRI
ncbi:MAG: cytochrome C biogenesis protein ResB [Nitrospirota bacterium]